MINTRLKIYVVGKDFQVRQDAEAGGPALTLVRYSDIRQAKAFRFALEAALTENMEKSLAFAFAASAASDPNVYNGYSDGLDENCVVEGPRDDGKTEP